MTILVALAILLIAFPARLILEGLVLSTLWGWFVSETFEIQQISIAEAIGIALIVDMLTNRAASRNQEDGLGLRLSISFLAPIFALAFGWVIYQFFM